MDTHAILEAAADGELDALLVFGADLSGDFPDGPLVQRALDGDVYLVVVELFPTDTATRADVLLPSAAYSERTGTFTNLERRLQKLEPVSVPPGGALEPWRICARIAMELDDDWGVANFSDAWGAIRRDVPTHAEVDPGALAQPSPPTALNYESGFHLSGDEARSRARAASIRRAPFGRAVPDRPELAVVVGATRPSKRASDQASCRTRRCRRKLRPTATPPPVAVRGDGGTLALYSRGSSTTREPWCRAPKP